MYPSKARPFWNVASVELAQGLTLEKPTQMAFMVVRRSGDVLLSYVIWKERGGRHGEVLTRVQAERWSTQPVSTVSVPSETSYDSLEEEAMGL